MGIKIIVVTGLAMLSNPEWGSPSELISSWLRCSRVCLEPILVGLRRQAADHIGDRDKMMRNALDILFHQASYLIRDHFLSKSERRSSSSIIVLDFPLSSLSRIERLMEIVTGVVETLVKESRRKELRLDDADDNDDIDDDDDYYTIDSIVIAEFITYRQNFVREILFEYKMLMLPLWFNDFKSWADTEKAIWKQHDLISSEFNMDTMINAAAQAAAGEERGRGRVIDNIYVSKLEIDLFTDYIMARKVYRDWQKQLHRRPPAEDHHGHDHRQEMVPLSPLYEALEYLLFRRDYKKDGPISFTMRQWGEIKLDLNLTIAAGSGSGSAPCFKGVADHDILLHKAAGPSTSSATETSFCCQICHEPVAPTAAATTGTTTNSDQCSTNYYYYGCSYCPLVLHKECAELLDRTAAKKSKSVTREMPPAPEIRVKLAEIKLSLGATIKEVTAEPAEKKEAAAASSSSSSETSNSIMHNIFPPVTSDYYDEQAFPTCKSCRKSNKEYLSRSQRCKACLFDTLLKKGLRPAVIHHPFFHAAAQQEFLQIQISSSRGFALSNICEACGRSIRDGISYSHKRSSTYYGFSCLLMLPVEVPEYKHFGCQNPLKLRNKTHEELDYHLCHVCDKEREPQNWYYFCDDCEFSAHVNCIRPVPDGYH